ncbi:MAG: Mu-like prophage protein Com [Firmicutes bacterium]|nr:Mu-like prophage protein Com [Bacillota bacterium]
MQEFRCESCRKLLGKYADCRYLEIKCPRCNTINVLSAIRQPQAAIQTKKA